jgi:2-polyprenyl-6-methoxyphenol hydroxylase-like FAD-dependent oxidoreductase
VPIEKVNWFSTYHTHHRATQYFRKQRAFLLGEAAHIHTCRRAGIEYRIADAINLAWKFKALLGRGASDVRPDTNETAR